MFGEFTSHFFLLPQKVPLAISRSMSGWSAVAAQVGGCWSAYRRRERTIAEPPTVHPKASEASWLRRWRIVLVSSVSECVRGMSGCFFERVLGRAIREIISRHEHATLDEEQIVTRTTNGRAPCSLSLLRLSELSLSFSLKRDNFHTILQ